jgi:hypothetical protein
MKKTKTLRLEHVVDHDAKEVWVKCDSAITAMSIPAMVNHYYPGYKGHCASLEYIDKLRNQQDQS